MTLQDLVQNIFTQVKAETDKKQDKVTGKGLSTNDYTNEDKAALANKVDKVIGKGLSTNDYTNEDKAVLDALDTLLDAGKTLSDENFTSSDKEKLDDLIGIPAGGTEGQILVKQSSEDGDVDWEDNTGGEEDPITSSDVEDIAEEVLGNSTPITITIDEPKVPGTTYTATAASALQKGDTVYLDAQEGEWSDITGLAGLSAYRYGDAYRGIALSTDGGKVFAIDSANGSPVVYDTLTTPWTKRSIDSLSSITFDTSTSYIGQDGDIALFRTANGCYLFNLSSEELIRSVNISLSGQYSSKASGNHIRIFDDILCVNNKATNMDTGEVVSNFTDTSVRVYEWISPYRLVLITSSDNLEEYELSGTSASRTCSYGGTTSQLFSPSVFLANGRLICINRSSATPSKYIDDYDVHPYDVKNIPYPDQMLPAASPRAESLSVDGMNICTVMKPTSGSYSRQFAILNTDTLEWSLIGETQSVFDSGENTILAVSSKIAIVCAGSNGTNLAVFQKTGSGLVARKIYNKIHNNKILAYAATDIAAGQKGTFITLFN